MQTIPSTEAHVVVIGGGVVRLSIAAQLSERGAGKVVVTEAGKIGAGSSAKPIGGFRAQFSDETNILLGLRSMTDYLLRFPDRYGVEIGANTCGYLFLITRDADVAAYERATEVQRSLGVDSAMVDADRVHSLNPLVPASAVLAGQFSPSAGTALPSRIVEGFRRRAVDHGAVIIEDSPVTGIEAIGHGAAVVHSPAGAIRTSAVVIAAGAWSGEVGRLVDVSLPVTPLRRQLGFTAPGLGPFPSIPFTLDAETTAYFHNGAEGSLLLGLADPTQQPGYGRDYDETWLALFRAAAARIAPALQDAPTHRGWAGLYEMTPDANALIGETDEPGFRVLYATGFSGHGVLQSPAVGEVVADLYEGRKPFVDVSRFSASRFRGGGVIERELAVI